MTKKTALITGVTGQDGAYLAELLLTKGYSVHGWNQPWTGAIASDWMEPDIYMDLARALERACFDCLIIEDGSFVMI